MPSETPVILQVVSSLVGAITLACAGLKPLAWMWLQVRNKAMDLQTKQVEHQVAQATSSSRGWEQLSQQLRTDWDAEKIKSVEMLGALEIRMTTQLNDQAAKILKQQTVLTEVTENNEELHALILQNQKDSAAQILALTTQLGGSQAQIDELRSELEQVHAERDDLYAVFLDISDQLRQAGIEPRRQPVLRHNEPKIFLDKALNVQETKVMETKKDGEI